MIFIFGGHGYIGEGLARFLKHNRIAFTNPTRSDVDLSSSTSIMNWLQQSGYSPDSDDSVIYLASTPKRSHWLDSDILKSSVNLRNLQRFFHECNFLFTSSVDIYGTAPLLPITENSSVSIESAYSRSKYEAERTLFQYFHPSQYLILRLPGIYGGLNPQASIFNRFVLSLLNDEKIKLRNSRVPYLKRDWIFRNDLVKAIAKMSIDKSFGLFNFASGRSESIDWWLRNVATDLGCELRYDIDLGEGVDQEFDLIFDTDKLIKEFSWLSFSNVIKSQFTHDSALS